MKKKTDHPVSGEKKSKRTKKRESTTESARFNSKTTPQNNDKENYPGYPPYPPSEDIFNNKTEKLELNEEGVILRMKNLPPSPGEPKTLNSEPVETLPGVDEGENKPQSEADVTPEEIKFLDTDHLNADGGDDELLRNRVTPVDMSGADLDVPGSELDDVEEAIGEEDEENNPYSIGGDRHEDLEEDSK